MSKNRLVTPEGTKDYLFEEAVARRSVTQRLSKLFQSRGFYEVVTPTLEFIDVFSVKGHGIPIEDMLKLCDCKGRLMVMRPDSTMPIARLASTRLKGAKLPLRLYYNQSVYSETRSMSGRSNQTMQSGIELIAPLSLKADLEALATAVSALTCCKQDTFRLELGHIGIFNSVIERLPLEADKKEDIRTLIESKNYPALNDMLDATGDSDAARVIKQLPRLFGGKEVFKRAADLMNDPETVSVLQYLEGLYDGLVKLGLSDHVTVDLGIVNRTDYYTGVVFKGYIEGYGEAVLSGGRYDSLLAQFGEDCGAIGFAVNVDVVARAILGAGTVATVKRVEVLVFNESGYELEGLRHLEALSSEMTCEFAHQATIEEAVAYANKRGIKRVDVVTDVVKSITSDVGGQ